MLLLVSTLLSGRLQHIHPASVPLLLSPSKDECHCKGHGAGPYGCLCEGVARDGGFIVTARNRWVFSVPCHHSWCDETVCIDVKLVNAVYLQVLVLPLFEPQTTTSVDTLSAYHMFLSILRSQHEAFTDLSKEFCYFTSRLYRLFFSAEFIRNVFPNCYGLIVLATQISRH